MKKFTRIFALLLALSLILLNFSCSNNGSALDFYYFNTGIHIETHDKPITSSVKTQIHNLFSSLQLEFNSNDGTFTSEFNNLEENSSIPISNLAKEILLKSKDYYAFSDEKFNIAVYPLAKLWKFTPSYPVLDFSPPTPEQINSLINSGALNLSNVVIENNSVKKVNKDTKIDFGGMLKGYASEKVLEILKDNGYKKGYVSVGSSSISLLEVSSLGIRHPKDNSKQIISVNTKNLFEFSVSTSGTYEKYYTHNDITYNHILDTKTGNCANTNIISATIINKDGTFCDAMTTALCLSEYSTDNQDNELIKLINKILLLYPDSSCYCVYDDGLTKQIITNKIVNLDFTLLDNEYQIVKI